MIVVLTGAGISQESGIATFRDSGGLWEQERIEDVATPQGFQRDPERVLRFYNDRRRELQKDAIAPNPAHLALARLEAEGKEPLLVITQNIDNLHERAGTRSLLHMHGELLKARCTSCEEAFPWETDMNRGDVCPKCGAKDALRPHIVWFEEMPLYMDEIDVALKKCRVFAAIGTSGNVYPAAGFSRHARANGARVVELNLEPSRVADVFHEGYYGPASQVVVDWVDRMLSAEGKASF